MPSKWKSHISGIAFESNKWLFCINWQCVLFRYLYFQNLIWCTTIASEQEGPWVKTISWGFTEVDLHVFNFLVDILASSHTSNVWELTGVNSCLSLLALTGSAPLRPWIKLDGCFSALGDQSWYNIWLCTRARAHTHTYLPLLHIGKLRLFHLFLLLSEMQNRFQNPPVCLVIHGLTPSYISDLLEPCDAPGPSNQPVRCFRLSLNLELNSDIFCPQTVEQHSNIKTYFYSLAFD